MAEENEFYRISKKLRIQINHLQGQIIKETNISELGKEANIVEQYMKELTAAQEKLECIQDSAIEKMTFYSKFEDMSRESNQILAQAGKAMQQLRSNENEDRHSVSASTHRSKSSHRSRLSRSSLASTSSSARLHRLDLEEEIATLRAKINLVEEKEQLDKANRVAIEEIERRKLEIQSEEQRLIEQIETTKETFKLKEQLAEKEARVEACTRFENEGMSVIFDDDDNQSNATREHIQKFLQSQAEPSAEGENNELVTYDTTNSPPPENGLLVPPQSQLNPAVPPYVPCKEATTSAPAPNQQSNVTPTNAHINPPYTLTCATNPDLVQAQLTAITKLLEVQNRNRLPLPEPGVFSGNPLQYPMWVRAFETLIESRAINPAERLHFLGKYVSGEAKEVVNGFMLLDGDDAYTKAKEMLAKRFGDPFTVAASFRKRLEEWKQIAPGDAIGLRRYSDFLVQCETAMEKVSSLNVLNDVQENQKMISKLPKWLSNRWARVVYKSREEKNKFPLFSEFVRFLVTESNIACDPVNLRSSKINDENKRPKDPRRPERPYPRYRAGTEIDKRNFATRSMEGDPEGDGQPKGAKPVSNPCLLCKEIHDLNSCEQFRKMEIKDRKKFAREKGLCYGCLIPGHTSKQCKKRKKCETCGKLHPTSLHGDFRENPGNDKDRPDDNANSPTVNCTKACFMNDGTQVRMSSMIIPVWINHSDNPETKILVYALLDDQSDTTFVTQEALKSLNVSGPETQLSLSTMHADNEVIASNKIKGLAVSDYDHNVSIPLPTTFSCTTIPAGRRQIPCPEMVNQWPHLVPIANSLTPYQHNVEIGLLIGSNCPRAIMPRKVIPGKDNEPYAQKTDLGWGIVGNVSRSNLERDKDQEEMHTTHACRVIPRCTNDTNPSYRKTCFFSVKTTTKEILNPVQVRQILESDFSEGKTNEQPISQDDRKFIRKVEQGIRQRQDGHYEMPLPFREEEPNMPNNKSLALHRLAKLKTRLENNEQYRKDYVAFMNDLVSKKYAERVPEKELSKDGGRTWYIPHHGVYHPKKPTKMRVVFDCSAKYMGESLNDHLLQGPDLTNQLIGVLCRFRQGPIAFMCDVESMFHQFNVIAAHQDFLRFLWWDNGDTTNPPVEFRMTVHLFGAGSSPGCANYGLKQIANDYEEEFGTEAANFVRDDFYVDDGLKSVDSVSKAVSLIKKTKDLCARGGLRLHKFVSNSKPVIEKIPPNDRASGIKNLDLRKDDLPIERALGVEWCIESDSFQLRVSLQNKPPTRRGILSTVSSIFDPIGFVAPLILQGKQFLQELCRDGIDWDDPIPEQIRLRWEKWRNDLLLLSDLGVQRCYQPNGFGELKSIELHHFSATSTSGYGQCSYLRLVNEKDKVHCSFVMGKARVSPLKSVTIPRLELTAALVSVKVSNLLHQDLNYEGIADIFWTDSKVVLGYINNDAKRFHIFVANRVQQIRECTNPNQWRYIESKENQADEASRGLSAQELISNPRWLSGPAFLWNPEINTSTTESPPLSEDDPEVKKVKSLATQGTPENVSTILQRLEYFSDWHRAKRAIAVCLKLRKRLRNRTTDREQVKSETRANSYQPVNVEQLRQAEVEIIKAIQTEMFPEEMELLRRLKSNPTKRQDAKDRKASLRKNSALYRPDPLLNERGKRNRVPTILERPIQKLVVLLQVEETENVEE